MSTNRNDSQSGYTGSNPVGAASIPLQLGIPQDVLLRLAALYFRCGSQIDHLETAVAAYRPTPQLNLPATVAEFLADCTQRNLRPRSIESYAETLRLLEAPTREAVTALLARATWGAWAKKHHLLNLRAFFNWCADRRLILQNPCDGIRAPLCETRVETVPLATITRVCKAIRQHDPPLLPLFCLLAFAGLRWSEASRIQPHHIHDGYIEVVAGVAKTRSRRMVPIYFSAATAARLRPVVDVRRRLRKLYRQAGVTLPRNALRKTFASMLVARTPKNPDGISPAGVLGHGEDVLYRHYRALALPAEAAAFFAFAAGV